jgi:chemotaxis protein CheX
MQASLATPESLADQRTIAQQVFSTMVDMELTPCSRHLEANDPDAVASLLRYTAPSEGAMLIECSPALAFTFAARLMSIARPSTVDADVIDAMGELVNMIGGNLKALMPEQTHISSPQVLQPHEREALLAVSRRLTRVCFTSGLDHCCISLIEPASQLSPHWSLTSNTIGI